VTLLQKNPALLDGESKNLLASVIYQNMEFESDQTVSELLAQVYQNGALKGHAAGVLDSTKDLLEEAIDVFELESVLNHALTHLSKGEIQRVILGFSILYGSASIFMDEPMFAMEDRQKESALSYLKTFVKKTGTTIYCSMHELDLTKKYADQVLLFYPNRDMSFGTPSEVLTDEDLEKAYKVPAAMLKQKESLTRDQLKAIADQYSKQGPEKTI
ncbi:MAG TPA: ABC transporter, partial [Treponema sp.]|nr:ABC transporter [Treponema sp.]